MENNIGDYKVRVAELNQFGIFMKHLIEDLHEVEDIIPNQHPVVKEVFKLEKDSYLVQRGMYECLPLDINGKRVAVLPVTQVDFDDDDSLLIRAKVITFDFIDLTNEE